MYKQYEEQHRSVKQQEHMTVDDSTDESEVDSDSENINQNRHQQLHQQQQQKRADHGSSIVFNHSSRKHDDRRQDKASTSKKHRSRSQPRAATKMNKHNTRYAKHTDM